MKTYIEYDVEKQSRICDKDYMRGACYYGGFDTLEDVQDHLLKYNSEQYRIVKITTTIEVL